MSNLSMNVPPEILEKRAAEQRRSLHNRVRELRTVVTERVREKTDVKRNVRRHFGPLAGIAAVVGLSLGWGLAGIFVE
jgi:hypothetical protein